MYRTDLKDRAMLSRTLLAVSLNVGSIVSTTAMAAACPNLPTHATGDFPPGQLGAALTGSPQAAVEPPPHAAVPDGAPETVEISLERSGCYGSCPSYSIELRGNGSATYEGKAFVVIGGHHDFTIPKADVQCLVTQFRKADFWSLEDQDQYALDNVDSPTYRLMLTIGGKTKSVRDYVGSAIGIPKAVGDLEDEIDRVAADRWVRGTSDTLASLRNENFDFHSRAAATILANGADKAPDDLILGLLDAGTLATGRRTSPTSEPGATAVSSAAGTGRSTIVDALIARGAFEQGPPDVKEDALRSAAGSGNPFVVAAILKHGPEVDARGYEGSTALNGMGRYSMNAYDRATVDTAAVARLLLAAGADPNIADANGITALFRAKDASVVKLLIEAGAKVDVRTKYGGSPLLDAETDEVSVALIEAGADTTVTSKFGDTVQKHAEQMKFERTLRLLQAHRGH